MLGPTFCFFYHNIRSLKTSRKDQIRASIKEEVLKSSKRKPILSPTHVSPLLTNLRENAANCAIRLFLSPKSAGNKMRKSNRKAQQSDENAQTGANNASRDIAVLDPPLPRGL